ncbi:MAG TPA: GerMN domain-containing protein [Thermoanaerobaculia bacterium]|nr:GerMN domain-containing protein [Thermoanaerobaculia bacterium]
MKRVAVFALAVLALAGACKKKNELAANINAANKVSNRVARFYYESGDMQLIAESRNIALPENPAAAIPVVARELMKGPAGKTAFRLFPPDTLVRGAYLLPGGNVIVDLGGPTLQKGWETGSHTEIMAIHSLVQTITSNFSDARRVRVLVNGSPAETLAGHISLARPFGPDTSLVEPRSR